MNHLDTAPAIAGRRMVDAMSILKGTADLRGYPHRLLDVLSTHRVGPHVITDTLAAVEVLESYGWELVSLAEPHRETSIATMRRRPAPAQPGV